MPENSTIDSLKTVISRRSGLARPTKFLAEFFLPPGISMDTTDIKDLSIICQTSSLPTRTILTTDYSGTQRHAFKIPSGYSFDSITCTFLLSNDFFPKNIFDQWLDRSVDTLSYRVRYIKDYSGTINLYQLDGNDDPVYGLQLNEAYPTSISPVELDASQSDQIHRLSVTFSFYDYEVFS